MEKNLKDLSSLKDLFPEMKDYVPEPEEIKQSSSKDLLTQQEKAQMKLYVSRDKKHRGGKQVTLVQGHDGPVEAQQSLLSTLKSLCSAGGALKEGELIIQGDHVKKVIAYLLKEGYRQTKQKGG